MTQKAPYAVAAWIGIGMDPFKSVTWNRESGVHQFSKREKAIVSSGKLYNRKIEAL